MAAGTPGSHGDYYACARARARDAPNHPCPAIFSCLHIARDEGGAHVEARRRRSVRCDSRPPRNDCVLCARWRVRDGAWTDCGWDMACTITASSSARCCLSRRHLRGCEMPDSNCAPCASYAHGVEKSLQRFIVTRRWMQMCRSRPPLLWFVKAALLVLLLCRGRLPAPLPPPPPR